MVKKGLDYYRARYYDPSGGRFLSEDETGFNDGVNFYRYVHNDPVDSTDPTGFTTYKGFPADREVQMRNAVAEALAKLTSSGGCNGSNPPCAGKAIRRTRGWFSLPARPDCVQLAAR